MTLIGKLTTTFAPTAALAASSGNFALAGDAEHKAQLTDKRTINM